MKKMFISLLVVLLCFSFTTPVMADMDNKELVIKQSLACRCEKLDPYDISRCIDLYYSWYENIDNLLQLLPQNSKHRKVIVDSMVKHSKGKMCGNKYWGGQYIDFLGVLEDYEEFLLKE